MAEPLLPITKQPRRTARDRAIQESWSLSALPHAADMDAEMEAAMGMEGKGMPALRMVSMRGKNAPGPRSYAHHLRGGQSTTCFTATHHALSQCDEHREGQL